MREEGGDEGGRSLGGDRGNHSRVKQEDDPEQRHEGPLWSRWREEPWWRDREDPGR